MRPAVLLLLRQVQLALEALYRLDPAPAVTDFVVPEEQQAAPRGREQLLVVEDGDLFLGLALDPGLTGAGLIGTLHAANLAEFCLLVEAVSHYLLVVHCARQQRAISALELELQGEVDKYVVCAVLAVRAPELPVEQLRQRLYDGFELVEGLNPEERERYVQANQLARRYTRALERAPLATALAELRRFYRLALEGKGGLIAKR